MPNGAESTKPGPIHRAGLCCSPDQTAPPRERSLAHEVRYHVLVNQHRLRFGRDGRVEVDNEGSVPELWSAPHGYDARQGPGGTWLLSPHTPRRDARWRVLMMGEIVTRMTVLEVINMVMSANWRGELHIVGKAGSRVLTIDQGALKHAKTDEEGERIGEVMVRAGHLSREDLTLLLPQKPPDKRFGQMLVELGKLSQDTLFRQIQQQAETIFYAALVEEAGYFWLLAPPDNAPPPPTTLHLPVQGLLMEGVQRIDEMALYRERIPHNQLFPVRSADGRPRAKLDEDADALLRLCDGTRNVDELSRTTSLTEFPTLKLLYSLLGSGQIKLLSGPSLDWDVASRLIRQFNDIVRDIFLAVATYKSMEQAHTALSRWLSESPHRAVLGEVLDVDGTLDANKVIAHIESAPVDSPASRLHSALHDLSSYALFIAGGALPRHEEEALTRDVNHRLKQLKL